ncbi:hypothetical protein H9Y04_24840 [Streptomyces sp. TRM66268-LWL]|uniref:Uncharacterized protein n=1 Tax=Streptomyces polyasparticus TaxID=2767826 RepID=A0ABR7SK11_9ACTN|nr:hypothetical protein [Streptomyces polyasparticus]MBC9715773.1 hypothetical protein [Streptomyces polyasparticus]
MTDDQDRRDLIAVCSAAATGYVLQVRRADEEGVLAEKDLSHWPDYPAFPFDAAHAAGRELIRLGYMIWPDTVLPAVAGAVVGWRHDVDQRAWVAQVGSVEQLRAAGI